MAEVDDSVKSAVIGIARQIALIVAPEGHYDWPETNLEGLDAMVAELLKPKSKEKEEKANEKAS